MTNQHIILIRGIGNRVHPDYHHRDRSLPWSLLDSVWYLIVERKIDRHFMSPSNYDSMELAEIGDMLL